MSTSSEYATELEIACLTVQRAARVTKNIIAAIEKDDALDKSDNTPVTIADFAAQALIISALNAAFPNDGFVGEETAAALRQDAQLCERVWDLVRSAEGPSGRPGQRCPPSQAGYRGGNAVPDRPWRQRSRRFRRAHLGSGPR